MVKIYNDADYQCVAKQKKRILTCFFVGLGVLLALNIAVFVVYTFQEFDTPYKTPMLLFNIISDSLFAIAAFPVMSVSYKRVKCYSAMLAAFKDGIKRDNVNTFVRVDSSVTVKDGVEFINLVFLEWSDKKQAYFESNVLADLEKPVPAFTAGDTVHYVTQANIIIEYELTSQDIFE